MIPSGSRAGAERVVLALACLLLASLAAGATAGSRISQLNEVQSTYLQHCGGCHGIQGTSVPRDVPSLRGQVGNFLCTPAGRAYLVRLPNVALAPLSDESLAQVVNFVVFELGGPFSERPNLPLFTAAEVAQLRKQPLTGNGLAGYRARIVDELIERCGAPASLREYSIGISRRPDVDF